MKDIDRPLGVQPEATARLRAAFPCRLQSDVDTALDHLPASDFPPTEHTIGPVSIAREALRIPWRIYSAPLESRTLDAIDDAGAVILRCLLTRHHDGFVRQRHVIPLLSVERSLVAPFVIQLIGEPVVEIIENMARHTGARQTHLYRQFVSENTGFVRLTKQRIISYWDCYYRSRWPRFADYPGFRLADTLGLWDAHDAWRLRRR